MKLILRIQPHDLVPIDPQYDLSRGAHNEVVSLVFMPHASYAVDIGVYNLGAKKQILSSTTMAWARSVEGARSLDGITHSGSCEVGAFCDADRRSWNCGRSISQLVDRIAADVESRFSVSLGLEAPMWFPIRREECANLQLFKPRFDTESGREWYLQSGAAATLKAVSIGVMLVGLLTSKQPEVRLTTNPSSVADHTIVLYEAFVVGEFKTPPSSGATQAGNEWDAFTASLAWGALNSGFNIPPSLHPRELHKAGSSVCEVASVWQIVSSLLPSKPPVGGPADCQIVGITRTVPAY